MDLALVTELLGGCMCIAYAVLAALCVSWTRGTALYEALERHVFGNVAKYA